MSSTANTVSTAAKTVKKTVKKVEEVAAPAPAPVVVPAPAPVAVAAEPVAAQEAEKPKRARKQPEERKPLTAESVVRDLEDLVGLLTGALADEAQLKKPGKVLRSVLSRVRKLSNDVPRLLRKNTKSSAPKDRAKLNNSGLMKPVKISQELSKFMGVAEDTLQSRVAVTNAICSYVKVKELQNPQNKREIRPDAILASLLGYAGDRAQQPLTYFYVQQLIQPHFIK
jgi:chromatin remodeling complex protein RSC6